MTTDPKDADIARLSLALADTEALERQHGEVIKRLTAERDAATADAKKWQADASIMLGFADLAYEYGAYPSSSELIEAANRAKGAIAAAAFEASASICADQFAAHMTAAICGDPDNSRTREAAAAMAERLGLLTTCPGPPYGADGWSGESSRWPLSLAVLSIRLLQHSFPDGLMSSSPCGKGPL